MAASAGGQDHYAALGVARTADAVVIAAAYRALAKKFHPDMSSLPKHIAAERFRRIAEAYEVLSDPQRRAAYDAQLAAAAAQTRAQEAPPGPAWEAPPQPGEGPPRAAKAGPELWPDEAPAPKASRQGASGAGGWLAYAAVLALGLFAAGSWPPLRTAVTVVLIVAAIICLVWAGPHDEPKSEPLFTPQPRPQRSRGAAMARGAFAAVALAVYWTFAGLLVLSAAIAVVIAVAGY